MLHFWICPSKGASVTILTPESGIFFENLLVRIYGAECTKNNIGASGACLVLKLFSAWRFAPGSPPVGVPRGRPLFWHQQDTKTSSSAELSVLLESNLVWGIKATSPCHFVLHVQSGCGTILSPKSGIILKILSKTAGPNTLKLWGFWSMFAWAPHGDRHPVRRARGASRFFLLWTQKRPFLLNYPSDANQIRQIIEAPGHSSLVRLCSLSEFALSEGAGALLTPKSGFF